MKAIEYVGGIGIIEVDRTEEEKISQLFEIIGRNKIQYSGKEYEPHQEEFREVMDELFPHFQLHPDMHKQYRAGVGQTDGFFHQIPKGLPCANMSTNQFVLDGKPGLQPELRVVAPQDGRAFMFVHLTNYTAGCIDDVAAMMGRRKTPPLGSVRIVESDDKSEKWPRYGIADIPRLDEVGEMYTLARERVENCEKYLTVPDLSTNPEEDREVLVNRRFIQGVGDILEVKCAHLKQLRFDARTHMNPEIRRQSLKAYLRALDVLAQDSHA